MIIILQIFSEFLVAFCLSPIPLMLLVTGIKSLGQKNQTELKHIIVIAVETEEEKLVHIRCSVHIAKLQ